MVPRRVRAVTAEAVLALLGLAALGYGAAPEAKDQPYRLNWGDRVAVTVMGYPGLTGEAEVLPDGTITSPVVGRLVVRELTLAAVEDVIIQILSRRLSRPEVYVSLVRARPAAVYVLGDGIASCVVGMGYTGEAKGTEAGASVAGAARASARGPFEVGILDYWRVSHLLSAVGGLRTRPELVHAFLRRETGETIPLDMVRILTTGAIEADPALLPGDMLFVNRIDTVGVHVAGQVLTPGSRPIVLGRTAGEAIAAAGGVLPAADLHHVLIVRADRSEVTVDLYDAIVNTDPTKDSLLQRGDVVIVPMRLGGTEER